MRIKEIINELSFYGRQCTKDCSGHKAGWDWERKHNTGQKRATTSNSFNNGTDIAISQANVGKRPIGPQVRGAKGQFTKFTPEK